MIILWVIIVFFSTQKKQSTIVIAENPSNQEYNRQEKIANTNVDEIQPNNNPTQEIIDNNITIEEVRPETIEQIPTTFNLSLTFFSQAPDANWNLPRQEACEEASVILAAYYINNNNLTKDIMRRDILWLVQRQKDVFGDYIHTTAQQTKEMYDRYYGDGSSKIIENPTIDDIKKEIAQWNIIIAPFAWRLLWNPHYSGIWPRYHMMVIKWYDDTHFYTHDVWTAHGENFKYSHQIIINANHDYVDGDITQWAKRMIVLSK